VLFDEVDELIRDRRKDRSDPFGRFLTTSMLPKLAQLWKQRRILFFVATNNISEADPAIRRSQRFDASIFAAPPSYWVKRQLLEQELGAIPDGLAMADVNSALEQDKKMNNDNALGIFALVRHDQMAELADLTRREAGGAAPNADNLKAALLKMGSDLEKVEWASSDDNRDPFDLWRDYRALERHDYRREALALVDELPADLPEGWSTEQGADDQRYLDVRGAVEDAISVTTDGMWAIAHGAWEATDDGLLRFVTGDAGAG
jgi:SpoVK/Ycf46/Vps4 family AAA+-type ATPase